MKIFLVLIILLTFYTNTKAQDNMEKVNSIIQTVKEKFAPDKRVAIFNIEATESGDKIIIKGETNLPDAKSELDMTFERSWIKFY